jgi:hypothetical protein
MGIWIKEQFTVVHGASNNVLPLAVVVVYLCSINLIRFSIYQNIVYESGYYIEIQLFPEWYVNYLLAQMFLFKRSTKKRTFFRGGTIY